MLKTKTGTPLFLKAITFHHVTQGSVHADLADLSKANPIPLLYYN